MARAKKHKPSSRQLRLIQDIDEPLVVSIRGQLVDKLGEIRAAIADLRVKEDRLIKELARQLNGKGSCEGGKFKFTVATYQSTRMSAR